MMNDAGEKVLTTLEKRARLEALLRRKAEKVAEVYPLSYGQQALWFLYCSAPQSAAYNTAFVACIRSPLECSTLQQAFQTLSDRHPSLRTTFSVREGEPVQRVHGYQELSFEEIDASAWSDDELRRQVSESYKQPFNLEQGPVFRVKVFRRSETDQILLLTFHHIACDAWSIWRLLDEFRVIYPDLKQGRVPALPPLNQGYKEYVQWQSAMLAGSEGERLWEYWRQQLSGTLPDLQLPIDRPRPPIQSYRGASHVFTLLEDLTQQLRELARTKGVTLYMILLSAFYILLHRYSSQDDILVGSPIAGRSKAEFAGIVGYFVNQMVLRADLSGNPTYTEFLNQVRQTVLGAIAHQDYPFPILVQKLHPARDPNRSPLFQAYFILQQPQQAGEFANILAGKQSATGNLDELRLEPFEMSQMEGQFDFTLEITDFQDSLSAIFKYNPDLFDAATISRAAGHFSTLLRAITENPEECTANLRILTDAEYRQFQAWNATSRAYPLEKCLHHLFEEQAQRTPQSIALIYEQARLTYQELNERANQLARHLQTYGVGPDILTGICAERSVEMVVGLYGILKAGGAYVPIDPTYPPERLHFMLEDAHPPVLLTQEKFLKSLPDTVQTTVICLDRDWPLIAQQGTDNPNVDVTPENLAYMIYTSGSTGTPKGALNTHRGICNRLHWMQEAYQLTGRDRVVQKTPFSFDVSVWEFFWPLISGACLVVAKPQGHQDSAYLIDLIVNQRVTTMHFVPSMLRIFLEAPQVERCNAALRQVMCSGEALPYDVQQRFFERLQAELHNLYGPTEAAVDVTFWKCERDSVSRIVPIGRPIANTQIYILDGRMQPVPIGAPGELYIGGVNVGRGYWQRPELTQEKFLPDPFSPASGATMYRTGDLARYLPDGNIEYLGRIDQQVKLRGFRIELGEIETILTSHPVVRDAAVIMRSDHSGEPSLAAYLALKAGQRVDVQTLRNFLAEKLPEYMVPAHIVFLDALPLSSNGKLDRRALPAPASPGMDTARPLAAAQNELEPVIRGIWQDVLKLEQIGLHDNFFDLGGHSLRLAQVQNALAARLRHSVPMVELFQYPTIAALARHLSGKRSASRIALAAADDTPAVSDNAVAIIGMACRFPGAENLAEFWQNLCQGVESVSIFSDAELLESGENPKVFTQPNYVRARAILSEVETFDAAFFGISPREAEILDPQHRLFLECAWSALEHAGYDPERYTGIIGVYAGVSLNSYLLNYLYRNPELIETADMYQLLITNDKDFLPTRTAYKLNLKGPAVNVQTACSTSLVAMHLACQAILRGECDMALAGGASVSVPQKRGYLYREGMILSPDGHCRAFDANAQGIVGGNGVGCVTLKRLTRALADGDYIHAIIKGSAVNNDGSEKIGYTAPSVEGQAAVIESALRAAGVAPDSVEYIEAHGTGTLLGDPVEIAALTKVFRAITERTGFCAIGSVKTNIGHLDAAAGVAGLIKTTLALERRLLPPSLNFSAPNPQIDFTSSPFVVNTALKEWTHDDTPRRAGVSSFGIGGTNVHAVLEEAPPRVALPSGRSHQLLTLSARTERALERMIANVARHLTAQPDMNLADVAYTLSEGRRIFAHRAFVVAQSLPEAAEALNSQSNGRVAKDVSETAGRPVMFLFSGQGTQYVMMGKELYEHELVFRDTVDRCAEILTPHLHCDMRTLLYPDDRNRENTDRQLRQTALTQPALFVIEYALARLWMSWGIQPKAMIGHSLGECVAACVAGVFSIEDALALVAARGRMMQALPAGSMLAVMTPEDDVRPLLSDDVSLAAVNAPSMCVVSGTSAAIARLERDLAVRRIHCAALRTSHAFHSSMMEPILHEFTRRVGQVSLHPPQIPYVSNVTGTWITADEATDPAYWATHVRQTVRFADGLENILRDAYAVCLEIGPGNTLAGFCKRHPAFASTHRVFTSLRHSEETQPDTAFALATLGHLWAAGVPVDWQAYFSAERRQRLPLPTYPFERQRFWVDSVSTSLNDRGIASLRNRDIANWFYIPSWERSLIPALDSDSEQGHGNWLIFSDEGEFGKAFERRLREQSDARITRVQAGTEFARLSEDVYSFDPGCPDDYRRLITELRERNRLPRIIAHLWLVSGASHPERFSKTFQGAAEHVDSLQQRGFYILIFLTQALGEQSVAEQIRLIVVSTGLHDITGDESLNPGKATILGAVHVIPQEYPNIRCASIDVVLPETGGSEEQTLINRLISEGTSDLPDAALAYRQHHRWVETYVPVRLDAVKSPACHHPRLRNEGVYMITGGTGGVGLELAEYLAKTVKNAKLVLIGRATFPPRNEWDQWPGRVTAERTTNVAIEQIEERLQGKFGIQDFRQYHEMETVLHDLCASYIYQYYLNSGIDMRTGRSCIKKELLRQLRILPKFEKFFEFFTRVLAEDAIIAQENDTLVFTKEPDEIKQIEFLSSELEKNFPELQSINRLLAHCVSHYGQALSGDIEAISVLYPEGQLDMLNEGKNELERYSTRTLYCHTLKEAIRNIITSSPAKTCRILEVGGGNGYLTQIILPELRSLNVEYYFTDIGRSLVLKVEKEAVNAGFDCMKFGVLDISRDPEEQGYKRQSADIILGLDVVHATPDIATTVKHLKTLLKPDGSLMLIESVKSQRWIDMVWGLTEAWWYFEDYDLRTSSPLLSLSQWEEVLSQHFSSVQAYPRHEKARSEADCGLIIASGLLKTDSDIQCDNRIAETQKKIQRLLAMEALGAEIVTISADVSQPEQMRSVVDQIHARFGSLHGVIHAAGIIGGSTIYLNTLEMIQREFASKVYGSLALDDAIRNEPLDFVVFCSSLVSITGNFGMAAYSAATAFQDAFARYKASVDDTFTVSIDWDRWQHIGMAVDIERRHQEISGEALQGGMTSAEGQEVFDRILSRWTTPHAVVSTRNLHALITQFRRFQIEATLAQPAASLNHHARPNLANAYVPPETEIESTIVNILQEVLGIDQIGIQDHFLDLGGDSLIAISVVSRLRNELGVKLPARSLYDDATVAVLAQRISALQWAANAPLPGEAGRQDEVEGVL